MLKCKRISERKAEFVGDADIGLAIAFAGMYPHVQTMRWPWGKLIGFDLVREIRSRKIELWLNWGPIVRM